ncbi:hypothetical protein DSO57_1025148 [Entomophthora muscae]|uniref:Uncharacterized protein n=1 Tax=Entomophthora muscae TaxID=34485 RepID=A0ACC2TP78_9FUNG|nr:hypothetical protein DSO57_1025148 [Entomophthora muscae]
MAYCTNYSLPQELPTAQFILKKACTREKELISCEETWITKQPLLFCNKYNYLPAYLVPMSPPLTPRPNHPQESVDNSDSTSTQIFGVMYITLTGLINYLVPYSKPWAILRKSISYIVKLAPILWWVLSSGPVGRPPASSQEPITDVTVENQMEGIVRPHKTRNQ